MSRSALFFFFLVCVGAAVAAAEEPSCADLVTCVHQGVDKGLRQLQSSALFPLVGKRLVLERRDDLPEGQSATDLGEGTFYQRASRLLDTHAVRAAITKSLSLRLFKTPQGPFDISLDVAAPDTDAQGRTFFKRRLQMALLPIMYKLGVMTTLLGVLVVMTAKGLTIGVILLILAVSSAVKHKLLWGGGHHSSGHYEVGYSSGAGWAPSNPGVHLHLHGLNKEHLAGAHASSSDYHHASTGYARNDFGPYNRAAHFAPSGQTA